MNLAPYMPEQANLSCPPEFLRLTMACVPQSQELLNAIQVPFGAIIHPLAETSETPVPIVEANPSGIVRCSRCRAYINPFVKFLEGGRRWRCNLCNLLNNVPNDYFSPLGTNGMRMDIGYDQEGNMNRPELMSCIAEFQAPADYMVRPPQPASYLFLLDVSYYSITTGILQIAANTLMQLVDSLPGEARTKVGILTFDSKIHFYDLSAPRAHMQVSSDLSDLFIPPGYQFLVNRNENRKSITDLLAQLPSMFQSTKEVATCLGAALSVAQSILSPIGGKLMVFTALLPTLSQKNEMLGPGRLAARFEPSMLGTPKELALLKPQGQWYKDFALECSRCQISVDTFLFDNKTYVDVATLSQTSQLTGGQSYFYHDWNAYRDGEKFCRDLERNLLRPTGFEAVMRVRCSHGIRVTTHLGNVFLRSSDLLALPNVDADKAFGVQFSITEKLVEVPYMFMQTALLYTTSFSERRIRVITAALPTTSNTAELYKYMDVEAVATLLGKLAIEKEIRNFPQNKLLDMARAFSKENRGAFGSSQQIPLPDTLQSLPLFALATSKTIGFRSTNDVHPDLRAASLNLMRILPTDLFIQYIYPTMYRLYPLDPSTGSLDESGVVVLPPILNLSSEKMSRSSIFLMDNGQHIFVWFGKEVSPDVINSLFGVQDLASADLNTLQLAVDEDSESMACRVSNVIEGLRALKPHFQKVYWVPEGSVPFNMRWFENLVEDRTKVGPSYFEWIGQLQKLLASPK